MKVTTTEQAFKVIGIPYDEATNYPRGNILHGMANKFLELEERLEILEKGDQSTLLRVLYTELKAVNGITPAGKRVFHKLMAKITGK